VSHPAHLGRRYCHFATARPRRQHISIVTCSRMGDGGHHRRRRLRRSVTRHAAHLTPIFGGVRLCDAGCVLGFALIRLRLSVMSAGGTAIPSGLLSERVAAALRFATPRATSAAFAPPPAAAPSPTLRPPRYPCARRDRRRPHRHAADGGACRNRGAPPANPYDRD
jgi:hypothetical protein